MRNTIILFGTLSIVIVQVNAYAFLQCTATNIITGLLSGLVYSLTNLFSAANSYTGCPAYCGTSGYAYSLYTPGILGILLENCYCTNTAVTASYTSSLGYVDKLGNCGAGYYQTTYINTNFVFAQCLTTGRTLSGGPAVFTTADPGVCFSTCASYTYLLITPNKASNNYACKCGTGYSGGTGATCGNGIVQQYAISGIIVSAARKKRDRILAEIQAKERDTYCPSHLAACMIPGTHTAYECIDPETELESCGGCIDRYFDPSAAPANATVGKDCTRIEGVGMGGVSCVHGQCQVTRCRPRYKLVDGKCERSIPAGEGGRKPSLVLQ